MITEKNIERKNQIYKNDSIKTLPSGRMSFSGLFSIRIMRSIFMFTLEPGRFILNR